MTVLEKIETRLREINRSLSVNMEGRPYSFAQDDERALLEAARDEIIALQTALDGAAEVIQGPDR